MTFNQLGLSKEILDGLKELGYEKPTPIQEGGITYLLRGRDLLAIANTGTGKTAAFALPILQKLQEAKQKSNKRYISKLIIAPTRELALQLEKTIKEYAKNLDIKIGSIYGGANIKPQIKMLQEKVDIVIATTGRLIDLVEQKHIVLTGVDTLVLDEADSMLDMGFIKDVEMIMSWLPSLNQNILCSATLGSNIKKLSNKFLVNPKVIEAKAKVNDRIEQIAYPVSSVQKLEMLSFLIGSKNMKQVLVFCNTKALSDDIVEHLKLDGLKAVATHGGKTPGARKKAIMQFKKNQVKVLVATDVAARGLDIIDLPYVINFDLPFMCEDYIHRIGRTARAGNSGSAITLLDEYAMVMMQEIEQFLKQKIPKCELEGFEVDKKIQMIAKKKIIRNELKEKKSKTDGAFGKKKASKEQKKMAKQRGKRIIGQTRNKK